MDPITERNHWDAQADTAEGAALAAFNGEDEVSKGHASWLSGWLPLEGMFIELGCGVGRLGRRLAVAPRFVVGVDVSPAMCRHANTNPPDNFRAVPCDGRTIPLVGEFDGAWSMLMFQHVTFDTVCGYLDELARLLKPGAPFLAQYVTTGGCGPLRHEHDADSILAAAEGFDEGGIWHCPDDPPEWEWLRLVRNHR